MHLYTKWRAVVPHPFKDELCPLPPNDIIRQVIKGKPRSKQTNNRNPTNNQGNNTSNSSTNDTSATATTSRTTTTTTRRPKPKEHETRTVVVNGSVVEADPLSIASDDEDSNYFDPQVDKEMLLVNIDETTPRRFTRGKTFLPPKPKATTTKAQIIDKENATAEAKQQAKEEKTKTKETRIMTRNRKRLQRESKTRTSKRQRRNTEFYGTLI